MPRLPGMIRDLRQAAQRSASVAQRAVQERLRGGEEEILDAALTDAGLSDRGRRILSDLDRWNELSGWYRQHLQRIRAHWEAIGKPQPLRLIDVGCGPGGMLAAVAAWAAKYAIRVELTGIDLSPTYLDMARARLPNARLLAVDATHTPFADQEFDILTTTLMLHHLPDPARAGLIREAGRIAQTQYIFDLERTLTGVVGWSLIAPALGMGEDTRHDGVQSVRRACTFEEFSALVAPLPVRAERAFPTGLFTSPAATSSGPPP